jgi:hypothetical protein
MSFSETTLVNYSTPDVLFFSKNSMVSTQIYYKPYSDAIGLQYTVSMNGTAGDRIEVHDLQKNVVAVIKLKTLIRDTVFFPESNDSKDDGSSMGLRRGKETAWNKWLVPTQAEDGQ